MKQGLPVPPRQRRPPPPLGSKSADPYIPNNNGYINKNSQFKSNTTGYFNSNNNTPVSYQNQVNNNYLKSPNNTRHQRMNSGSSAIIMSQHQLSSSPQPMNGYNPQYRYSYSPSQSVSYADYNFNLPQGPQGPVQSSPSSSIRGPPPKINYSTTANPQNYNQSPINNSIPLQQQPYGQSPGYRLQAPSSYDQRLSPEIYVSSDVSLPNPPRKYPPSQVSYSPNNPNGNPNNVPPTPRRQVIAPSSNTHAILPVQISPVRSNPSSSPSLSPQLVGSNSPKPPPRRSMLISGDSPSYRYAHPSYSPGLGESAPPVPARQYQRARNQSVSSQKLAISSNNGIGNSSPNSIASVPRYDNANPNRSPSIHEDSGLYKSSSHRRNYSYSSSSVITVPNMDLNDPTDDSFTQDISTSLSANDNKSASYTRYSMVSQASGVSQHSGVNKLNNNNSEIKEYSYGESSDDEYIEEAKGAISENRMIIEAEEIEKDLLNSNLILDEKTLADSTDQTYKNLDPKEAKEIQNLSMNLMNYEDGSTIQQYDDFDMTAIANEIGKRAPRRSDVSLNNVEAKKPSLDFDVSTFRDDENVIDEVERSNQALLNVLTDEIKDLFKQVDENDSKDKSEQSSNEPKDRKQIQRLDSVMSDDSLHVEDVFTHLNHNDSPISLNSPNSLNSPISPSSVEETRKMDDNKVYKHNSYHSNTNNDNSYHYEERPSISYRNSVYSTNDGYYVDEKSFSTYLSSADTHSIRGENLNSISSPSLDPTMSATPPKRPLRYYEKNNNQRNESISSSVSSTTQIGAQTQSPAVPPRRHYRAENNQLSKPQRRQSLEIVPPTPPRTNVSHPVNRRIGNTSNVMNHGVTYGTTNEVMSAPPSKSNTTMTTNSVMSSKSTVSAISSLSVDESKEEKFEDDFVYHSGDIREKFPLVYHSASMSEIAANFRKRIKLVKHIKDSIEYLQSFSGYDAVTALADILGTNDRKVAQLTGQALEDQGMFHDVVYLHKLLDSHHHYYQFEDLAKPIAILERRETEKLNPEERSSLMRKLSERKGAEFEESNPVGVLVNIAQCYSPTCTEDSPCYSYSCPRRKVMETVTAKETAGRFANMAVTIGLQTTWSTSLGKSYVSKMTHQAIKRQEIMYEFIRTEKEYVNDLQSVIKYMIGPLIHGKVIGIDSRFVDDVFGNIEEIAQVNNDFYENLRKIQKRKPVLESMGDVVKENVKNFKCYTKYGEKQPSAKQKLQIQKNQNPHLNNFLKECQNMPHFRRLPIESFLARPTTRLGRYPILIRDILKNTSKNHRDQILLKEANTIIEDILKEVNQLAGKESNRLKMEQWSDLLGFETKNDISSVHINDPKREYIREGKLSLIVYNFINEPVVEVTLLLLDNVIIITYEKNNNYHIYGKPIPISLLVLSHSDQKRSLKPHNEVTTKKLVLNNHSKHNKTESMGYVFTVKHLGVGTYTFFTPILSEQKAWVEAIQKQQDALPKPIAKEVIFFSYAELDSPVQTVHRLKNGVLLLANETGLYFLINNTLKPLLQLNKITQIESMEQFDLIFLLANRETYAFSIELLLKGVYTKPIYVKHNKKISSNVSFIATGFCDDKFILCCAKASNNKTVVKMFEPKKLLANINYRKTYQKLYLTGDVMTSLKPFYIPSEGVNIKFLRRSLCVACIKSFEVVNIRNLTTQSLLNPNDVVFKNLLKSEYSPMNMFKTEQNDFLLCYNKIGFFIDKNGNRSRPNLFFKWNAQPKSFAYCSPYIYVITSEYISIWNEFDTEAQKQVISGNSIRLLLHDDNKNLVYSKLEKGNQLIATIELINKQPVVQTQMQLPQPKIKN